MGTPRKDLMRLLVDIDQELTELRELIEGLDKRSSEATTAIYRFVCLQAARLMVEEKLNVGENPEQPDWTTIVALRRLSKNWPDGQE